MKLSSIDTISWLVGGLEHFLFSHILGIIIPIDFHIFQRGSNHQPVMKWVLDKPQFQIGGARWAIQATQTGRRPASGHPWIDPRPICCFMKHGEVHIVSAWRTVVHMGYFHICPIYKQQGIYSHHVWISHDILPYSQEMWPIFWTSHGNMNIMGKINDEISIMEMLDCQRIYHGQGKSKGFSPEYVDIYTYICIYIYIYIYIHIYIYIDIHGIIIEKFGFQPAMFDCQMVKMLKDASISQPDLTLRIAGSCGWVLGGSSHLVSGL